jgi:ribokinase
MTTFRIVGSLNMDLVVTVDRFPRPGETITGYTFKTVPGGKGANQAVALARLGAAVSLFGRAGMDSFGDAYIGVLKKEGVATGEILRDNDAPTGIALIEVDRQGENHIVVVPGTNGSVTPEDIRNRFVPLSGTDILLLQLEIPLESVNEILMNRIPGTIIILDPAPARELPASVFPCVDYLTPNTGEIEFLSGIPVRDGSSIQRAAELLLKKGTANIIVKAGSDGAYFARRDRFLHIPPYRVDSVDTTGAGDSFNGAFAFFLGKGFSPEKAIRFANAAAALSTLKEGAQSGMPTEQQVLSFMRTEGV